MPIACLSRQNSTDQPSMRAVGFAWSPVAAISSHWHFVSRGCVNAAAASCEMSVAAPPPSVKSLTPASCNRPKSSGMPSLTNHAIECRWLPKRRWNRPTGMSPAPATRCAGAIVSMQKSLM